MAQRDRIYRREDIVYYHELDNNNEATQDQDWNGHNQAVVSDIVVSGMAPVPASAIGTTFETPVVSFPDGRGDNMYMRMKKLDDDRIALLYSDTTSQGVAVVGTVSGTSSGCTMNWGTPLVWSPNVQEIGLCVLTSGRIVAVGSDLDLGDDMWAWAIDVDANNNLTIASSGDSGLDSPVFNACEVHESGFCIQYNNIAGGSSIRHRVIAGAIDDSDNFVWNTTHVQIGNTRGARNTPNSNRMGYDARRRSNKVMFTFEQDHDDRPDIAIVEFKGVSGIFTMTTNGETDLDTSSGGSDVNAIMLDRTRGVASYYRLATTNLVVRPFMVSGIDITYVGPAFEVTDDAQDFEQNGHDLVRLSDNQFVIGYDQQLADEANATSGSVSGMTSGDLTINFLGAQNLLPSSGGLAAKQVEGAAMDSTRIVWILGEDADNDIWSTCGTMVIASELTATGGGGGGGGGGYSNTNGSTNIGVGFWSNSPTDNSSTLTVNVGQTITFVGDTVILNDDVSWDISSLDLNDGDTHLTLLEFTNTSGDNWELMVSVDGSGFVDFGEGSGTTSNTTSGSVSPGVSYTTSNPSGVPESGQYVDELLVWASDGMIFDDQTALNMFNLGQSGIPQGQYLNLFPSGAESGVDLHMFASAGQDCFLGSGNVIYYHPLDDLFEATEYEQWAGSGAFVPGKLNEATSAIASSFAWDSTVAVGDNPAYALDTALVPGTDKIVAVYRNHATSTAGSGVIRVGDISNIGDPDTISVTWGDEISFYEPGCTETRVEPMPDQSGKVLVSFRDPFNNEDGAFVVEVSGLTVASGARALFKSTNHSHVDLAVGGSTSGVDEMTFWVSWQEGGTGAGNGRVGIIDLNTSGITYTGESGWVGGTIQGANKRIMYGGDDTYVSLHTGGGVGRQIRVGKLAGAAKDEMYWPDGVDFYHQDPGDADEQMIEILSSGDSKAVVCYTYSNAASNLPRHAYSRIFTYDKSSLSITLEDESFIAAGTSPIPLLSPVLLFALSDTRLLMQKGSKTLMGTVNDDDSMTWGSVVDGPDVSTVDSGPDAMEPGQALSESGMIMAYGDGFDSNQFAYAFGNPEFEANITSTFAYPSGIDKDHIVAAFWARNATASNTQINLTRDFTVSVSGGLIQLDSISWSGSAIDTFTSGIGDSTQRFAVLDLQHTTGGNWVLKTSTDGAAFVDQGSGDGTKLPSAFTDDDARIQLLNPSGIDLWVDETILWAGESGTFAEFTTEELGNLYALADTFQSPMYQYCDTDFSGMDSETQDGTGQFSTIEQLMKNFNYRPQIIGRFTSTTAVSATIEVWEVNNGVNSVLSLQSNVCYAIGNTGRFGWDTVNLPPMDDTTKQYFYRMTSNLAETFEGQFTVNCFNFKPEHRLRRRRR